MKEESKLNEYYGMPGGMGSSASKRLRADYDDEEYLKKIQNGQKGQS